MHQHSPYGELIGTRILRYDEARRAIEIEYQATERFANRLGKVAGAMIAGMLDSVTGLVANMDLDEGVVAVHVNLNVAYHRPVEIGRVQGFGHVVFQDDREIRSAGELRDEAGTRLASADAVLRILRRETA